MNLTSLSHFPYLAQEEEQPRTTFGPLSTGEETYDPILAITSVVVLLVILVIGFYVTRYFRNHRNKK
ncbi:hypothetical protein [Paenibacillus sp. Marseille-Q4541]|uniref:hypothetical protein n=1 Tax=Paenibacillus sp. Marseille-Q4541 TaxID=2831522 RepID=UPI001BA73640|nr:hypothetical protein [Paenibacillus sp. Marseille-Q4541]